MKFVAVVFTACLLLTACGHRDESSQPETVRISFLNTGPALNSTLKFLAGHGCRDDAVDCLQKAIERYNSVPLAVDLRKFPPPQNGFYTFPSAAQLVAALSQKLWETPHAWELNCFDTVIIVTARQFYSALGPDDVFGVSLSPQIATNGELRCTPTTTAREAFSLSTPGWYLVPSQSFIPLGAINARMNLTAAMYSFNLLPLSTSDQSMSKRVFETLRVNWRRQAIRFPSNCQVVLCHEVRADKRSCLTMHAGLLFLRRDDYTYLEKDSGPGPFVRLDFHRRAELLTWLSSKFNRHETGGDSRFFVTFNDAEVEELPVNQ